MTTRGIINFPFTGWRHPFTEMDRLSRQMDYLTQAMFGRPATRMLSAKVFPAINITEDAGKYYIRAELPGIKADEIKLEVTGKNLSLSGERKIPSEGENVKYHRREREAGRFSRIIGLPGEIDTDSVDARLVNGLLTVTIAKSEDTKPRQITVN